MAEVQIYHNPNCTKSRATLQLLRERGIEPEIILYLENPPDETILRKLVEMLGPKSGELLRSNEPEFAETGFDADAISDAELIECILRFPKMLQRPIVVHGAAAAIGRPPENVLEIL